MPQPCESCDFMLNSEDQALSWLHCPWEGVPKVSGPRRKPHTQIMIKDTHSDHAQFQFDTEKFTSGFMLYTSVQTVSGLLVPGWPSTRLIKLDWSYIIITVMKASINVLPIE